MVMPRAAKACSLRHPSWACSREGMLLKPRRPAGLALLKAAGTEELPRGR